MKALKITGLILGILILIVLLLGVIAPKTIKATRTVTIDAPIEKVFHTVNDLKTWEKWSPWKEMDPASVITMGEKTVGEGASYTWKGDVSGSGKMTILESDPNSKILIDVAFDGMGGAKAPWTFTDSPEGVQVGWGFDSRMPFPVNAMLLFTDMSEAVGNDFEKGLNNLKNLIEMEEKNKSPKQTIMEMDMPYKYMVGIRKKVKMSEIQQFQQESLGKVYSALVAKDITMAGQPCGLYFSWDDANQSTDMLAAIPVIKEVNLGKDFETVTLPESKAVVLNFYGDYQDLEKAHNIIDNYLMLKKLEPQMPVIEEYITDPSTEPDPKKWLTKVVYPIK